jgi:hypothetical protein
VACGYACRTNYLVVFPFPGEPKFTSQWSAATAHFIFHFAICIIHHQCRMVCNRTILFRNRKNEVLKFRGEVPVGHSLLQAVHNSSVMASFLAYTTDRFFCLFILKKPRPSHLRLTIQRTLWKLLLQSNYPYTSSAKGEEADPLKHSGYCKYCLLSHLKNLHFAHRICVLLHDA